MRTLLVLVLALPLVGAPGSGPTESPCYLTVHTPVGATLTVNGARTQQMTAVRKFVSPPLPLGKTFYYTFESTWTSNGEGVGAKKQVAVKAGENLVVNLMVPDAIAPFVPEKPKKVEPFQGSDEPKTEEPKKDDKKKSTNPFRG